MSSPSLRILIIEDSRPQVELVIGNLTRGLASPFEMETESELSAGLDRISNEEFDLLFLDLNLPDSTGFETFLQAQSAAGEVPIVIISGETDIDLATRAVREGAQDYIIKGEYTPESLVRSTRFAIERNHRIQAERELMAAADVQRVLYPRVGPQLQGFELSGAAFPAERACGDYYDFIPMPDDTLAVAVGDVSGHGMKAALFMVELRACLHIHARKQTDVASILGELNELLIWQQKDHFVSLFLGRLNAAARTFEYASAGHRGYLLDRHGNVTTLESTGIVIGVSRALCVRSAQPLALEAGDLVFLPTDGIAETLSPDKELFGIERTLDVLRENYENSPQAIIQSIYLAAREFAQNQPQRDDISAVVLKATQ